MSSRIWTRCAGNSRVAALAARPWRAVEAQHFIATRKLVDSAEEQAILEELLEENKPPVPGEPEFHGRHFLLTTSFRYPPLRHGSRFSTRHERALWYGSKTRRTVFAEAAYYRFVFLEGSDVDLGPLQVDVTLFRVRVRTRRGIDLTRPPFDEFTSEISSKDRYRESQELGRAMRDAGVAAFRFRSARDRSGGVNVALFTPAAFAESRPELFETWISTADRATVEFQRKDFFERKSMSFPRSDFLVSGELPAPAV